MTGEKKTVYLTPEQYQALMEIIAQHDRIVARGRSEELREVAWKSAAKVGTIVAAVISVISTAIVAVLKIWESIWPGK